MEAAEGPIPTLPSDRIYLDHAATTPLLPQAREAMLPWLDCGNPSSLYAEGRAAKAAIDQAREIVSAALGCEFGEVLFTSGGTEAANTALLGAAVANEDKGRNKICISAAEHHCVLGVAPALQKLGYSVEMLPVNSEALAALKQPLDPSTLLVAVMHANNELGTINQMADILPATKEAGALLFVDAVQTFGHQLPTPLLDAMPSAERPDLLSVSAHKIGGPKGVGALFIRAGTKLKPLISGGGQEREMRGGTENVAAIVGFAAAIQHWRVDSGRLAQTRDIFETLLQGAGAVPTVTRAERLPGHCHVRFPGIDAETLLIGLDLAGVAASSGAACSSGSVEPSHVLLACGYDERQAKEGLRFTFGPDSTPEEAQEAARRIAAVVTSIMSRRKAP
jgi:cysteine desulfurase